MNRTEYVPSGKGDCAQCHRSWWWCQCNMVMVPNPNYIGRK